MVRVAGLKRQVEKGVLECGPDGMTPSAQLTAIRERIATYLMQLRVLAVTGHAVPPQSWNRGH